MRLLWAQHSQEEDWGFLLIDVQNAFNEEDRTAMIWDVRYECSRGAGFTFNCYCHWATLVVRKMEEGSGQFLHSKEDVTQGDPLYMIEYGIGILPLIREIWDANPCITQPMYADDAGVGEKFGRILAHLQDLQARGPPQGYSPELTKSILVVDLRNMEKAEDFFCGMGIKVVKGSCYLGVFFGNREAEDNWLMEKVQGWKKLVKTLSGIARNHL